MDQLIDEFDNCWNSGEQPSLEDFLAKGNDLDRDELAKALIEIDVEYRTKNGQQVSADVYEGLGSKLFAFSKSLLQSRASSNLRADNTIEPRGSGAQNHVPDRLSKSTWIGPYKLLQQIGEGGMGTVWMAEQEEPVRRRVALKLIKGAMADKQIIARFEAERQALAMMDHPNIAKVFDAGTSETGNPYFVMELIKGTPLNEYCDKHELSINDRLQIMVDVCEAIQHAHQKGILHRDLKPANVLVAEINEKPVAKVIDFGLAKALEHTQKLTDKTMFTQFGQVVGTLQYMSPEQAEMDSTDIDTRTDIYAIGVMLYELLAGSTPLDQETLGKNAMLQVLQLIREKEPPRPSARLSSAAHSSAEISRRRNIAPAKLQSILKGELDWIVMKSIDKDRKRRYDSAAGFADDIRRFLDNDPVLARPPSTGYRLRKFVQKNKGLVASVAAIFLLLLAGIGGTTFGLLQANHKSAEAEKQRTEAVRQKSLANAKTVEAKASEVSALAAKKKAEEEKSRADVAAKKARDSDAAGKFQLAQARWDANRAGEARDLLEKIPNEEDYRNFEWYFSRRHFSGGDVTCYGHTYIVTSVAFSPDGCRIASSSSDNTIKIWDAVSGKELQTLRGYIGALYCVAFSPDGRRLAVACEDRTIKIRDVISGRGLQTLRGHRSDVHGIAFSPDGSRLVSGSFDKTVKIWDVVSGRELKNLRGHTDEVRSVAFSPDGRRIVSGSFDKTVKIWDADSGRELQTLLGHRSNIHSVAYSPDGQRLASGSGDYTLKIWSAIDGRELKSLTGHTGSVRSVGFSPDGTRLVSTGEGDMTLKIWDADSGSELQTLRGHTQTVKSVAFSPDGRRLASASDDMTLKIWDTVSSSAQQTLLGHSSSVYGAGFSPDSRRLASASKDKTVKIWDTVNGRELKSLAGHTGEVRGVAYSPDGNRLASASDDMTLKLWNADNGSELQTLRGHTGRVTGVAFSSDGSLLASASSDKTVIIWDAVSGSQRQTLRGHTGPVNCVSFSADGFRIVSASDDRSIKIWDSVSGGELETLRGHTKNVVSVAFSPDGHRIASASWDNTVKIWDAASGSELQTLLGHTDRIRSVAFSPDGSRLASAGYDKTLKIWDAVSGSELQTLRAHDYSICSVTFSADGRHLVTASSDKSLKIWHAVSGSEIKTLRGHSNLVVNTTFSSDGTMLYSQSRTKNIIWDRAKGKALKDAHWDEASMGGPKSRWDSLLGRRKVSPDGRWLASREGEKVLVVDLEFKNTAEEKAYRAAKARFNPWWHREQARNAVNSKQWFSASFHFGWLFKNNPEDSKSYDNLQLYYEKLVAEHKEEQGDIELLLPDVVKEVLDLPRIKFTKHALESPFGKKPHEITANDAQLINNSTWNWVATPDAFKKSPLTEVELFQYRELVKQHPRGIYFNTLGTAEYRMGNYKNSIAAALKSVELTPAEMNLPTPHSVDFAILAMSYLKLDEKEKANKYRDKLNEAMKLDAFKDDEECKSFAKEVEVLFEAKSSKEPPVTISEEVNQTKSEASDNE